MQFMDDNQVKKDAEQNNQESQNNFSVPSIEEAVAQKVFLEAKLKEAKELHNNSKNDKNLQAVKLSKTFYFLGGLPRSGSTLLCNILAQNPRFHTTSTSGILGVIMMIRNNWDNIVEFVATPNEPGKIRVMRGILENYYSDVNRPIVFDKSRGWVSNFETIESVLGHKIKVIVPVRDIRDILASFEKLWRRTSETKQIPQEKNNFLKFQSIETRTEVWLHNNQVVGSAYNNVKDALIRGYGDRMLFVDFNKLTSNPKEQIKRIYDFLGEDYFEHNFDHVEQVTWEDDRIHGFVGLHDIRTKVEPVTSQWQKVLGPFAEKYGQLNFWDKLI
jgi:sulfotransferase